MSTKHQQILQAAIQAGYLGGVSDDWILQPEAPWEITGYVSNVVFTCGAVPEDDGSVKIYWGGADTVMCAGTARIEDLVEMCIGTRARPPL